MSIVTHDWLQYWHVFFFPNPFPPSGPMKDQIGSSLKGVPSMKRTYPGQTGQKCSHKSAELPHYPSLRGRGHSQHQSTSLQRDK